MKLPHAGLLASVKRLALWAHGPMTQPLVRLEAVDGGLQLQVKGPTGWLSEWVPTVPGESTEESWGLTAEPRALLELLSAIHGRQELEIALVEQAGGQRLQVEGAGFVLMDPRSGLQGLEAAGVVPEVEAEELWGLELPAERWAGLLDWGQFAAAEPEVNPARAQLILQAQAEEVRVLATDGRVLVAATTLLAAPVAAAVESVLSAAAAKRLAAVVGTLEETEPVTFTGLADGQVLVSAAGAQGAVDVLVAAGRAPEPPAVGSVLRQLADRQPLAQVNVTPAWRRDFALVAGSHGARAVGLAAREGALVATARRDTEAAAEQAFAVISLPASDCQSGEVLVDGQLFGQLLHRLSGEAVELSRTGRFVVLDQLTDAPVTVRAVLLRLDAQA